MIFLKIPKNIKIKINDNFIEIVGPLGIIKKKIYNDIILKLDEKNHLIYIKGLNNKKTNFFSKLLLNVFVGVKRGFIKKLNIIGVGYKALIEDNFLILKIGFSHLIKYKIPLNVNIKITNIKGVLTLIIFGIDLYKVSQISAEIRKLKIIEPYKGKGIKYLNEIVKKKRRKKKQIYKKLYNINLNYFINIR